MSLTSVLLGALLGAATVMAVSNVQLGIDSPSGLTVLVSPDSGSILVSRVVPAATSPPPTEPSTSTTIPPSSTQSVSPGVSVSSTTPQTQTQTPSQQPTVTTSQLPPLTTIASTATTGVINVTVSSIRELDSNMTEVDATPAHNFNGFAGLGLGTTLGQVTTSSVPSTSPPVQASCQKIIASLPINSTIFGLSLCAVESNGTATYGDESDGLATGQLVWSVNLENWPWTQSGAFIELSFTVSVPTGRQVSQTSTGAPVVLGLGVSGSYAVLSTKFTTSAFSTFNSVATGYPLLTSAGTSTATVTVMFPRQQSTVQQQSIVWNGVIEPGYQADQKQPGPVAAAAELLPMWIMQVATVALVCLMRFV